MNIHRFHLNILIVITFSLMFGLAMVQAQTGSSGKPEATSIATPVVQQQGEHLRVAIPPVSPFAFHKGEEWTGFSIDLWDAIAKRLVGTYEWVVVKSRAEQLDAVQSGAPDIAVPPVPITHISTPEECQSYTMWESLA
jgi:ABC-type amino acid transport substrate-binding protein